MNNLDKIIKAAYGALLIIALVIIGVIFLRLSEPDPSKMWEYSVETDYVNNIRLIAINASELDNSQNNKTNSEDAIVIDAPASMIEIEPFLTSTDEQSVEVINDTEIAGTSTNTTKLATEELNTTEVTTEATYDVVIPEVVTTESSEIINEVSVTTEKVLNAYNGVNQGPTGKETYYNLDMSGVISIMRSIGFSEEEYPYWVREDGVKMLGNFVMVAANLESFPRGSLVETSLGTGIVCDTGEFAASNPTQLDIATSW